jgi:NAD(P)H dehydrogenase (quinone)
MSTRRVLVLFAHPSRESLNGATFSRVMDGLRRGGHEVRFRDLYAEEFDSRLTLAEKHGHLDPPTTKPQHARDFDDLRWCDTLVLVHPTWWGAQPAILKGWFDRTFAAGVAFTLPPGAKNIRPALSNVRRIITVTTHGATWRVNALQGVPGRRIVNRGLRAVCHPLCRTSWIALYALDRAPQGRRERFLRRVERRMARL